MVLQSFQNVPEMDLCPHATLWQPECGTRSIPCGRFTLARLVHVVQGFLQDMSVAQECPVSVDLPVTFLPFGGCDALDRSQSLAILADYEAAKVR